MYHWKSSTQTYLGQEKGSIFRPQCIDCRKNINKDSCEEFKSKPKDYAENQVECPLFVARYEEE